MQPVRCPEPPKSSAGRRIYEITSASNILGTWLDISSQASHYTHITGTEFHTYRTDLVLQFLLIELQHL